MGNTEGAGAPAFGLGRGPGLFFGSFSRFFAGSFGSLSFFIVGQSLARRAREHGRPRHTLIENLLERGAFSYRRPGSRG